MSRSAQVSIVHKKFVDELKDRRDFDVIAQIGAADRTRIGNPTGYLEPICSHLEPLEELKRATGWSATSELNRVQHNCQPESSVGGFFFCFFVFFTLHR